MKIVFYNRTLMSGGIEKCIELLSSDIYKDYEIEVVYLEDANLDQNIVNILSRYAKVYKIDYNSKVECDICVWCFLYFDYEKLKKVIDAKQYITWIHSMPRILPDCLLDNKDYIEDNDHIICVSEAVQNNLNIDKESMVIHNFISNNIQELANEFNPYKEISDDVLKLSVVSRLSTGKGFERLLIFCNTLKMQNVPFHLKIVGKGRKKELEIREWFKNFEEVEFTGYQENPYPYIKNSDYLVQLSDDESWCNSITEAKVLHTPVIVTNFESSKEQITNLQNGIVVDLEATDYKDYVKLAIENKSLLKSNLKDFKYENELDKWLELYNCKIKRRN